MNVDAVADEATEFLVFEVDAVRYGIVLADVREVVRAVLITPLPDAPAVIEGVIDVRGEIVPVYDLRLRFGRPPRALDPDEHLVMAWTGERRVAMRCDRADWIERVPHAALHEAEAITRHGRQLTGVAMLPDGLVLVHDPASFLDEAERDSLEHALVERHGG